MALSFTSEENEVSRHEMIWAQYLDDSEWNMKIMLKIDGFIHFCNVWNSKISMWKTEIVNSEDRQNHGKQIKTKDKHRTHDTTLNSKARVTGTLQKPRMFVSKDRLHFNGNQLCIPYR